MKFKKYATKTLMIVIGSIISAYGITLAIGAGFGGATLAILWQGLTNVTGMSIGTSSLVVAVAMIIFAFFYDRKANQCRHNSLPNHLQFFRRCIHKNSALYRY